MLKTQDFYDADKENFKQIQDQYNNMNCNYFTSKNMYEISDLLNNSHIPSELYVTGKPGNYKYMLVNLLPD